VNEGEGDHYLRRKKGALQIPTIDRNVPLIWDTSHSRVQHIKFLGTTLQIPVVIIVASYGQHQK
jgi:hypothetical protein